MADQKPNFTVNRKGMLRNFTLYVSGWNGLITNIDPIGVPDNFSVWIEGLPRLNGSIATPPAPTLKFSHTIVIVQFCYFEIGTNGYFAILDANNTLNFYSAAGSLITTYANFGTQFAWAMQGNKYIYCTSNSVLLAFNGTTIYPLTGTGSIQGNSIVFWKGRIFVGSGTVINYSIINADPTAGTAAFWATANGAGYVDLSQSFADFSVIGGLDAKVDTIYVYCDNCIIALIGSISSNTPTNWYFQQIVKDIGTLNQYQIKTVNNTTYFSGLVSSTGNFGINAITSSVPQRVDLPISNIKIQSFVDYFMFNGIQYVGFIGQSLYSTNNIIYSFDLENQGWYALNCGFSVSCISSYGAQTYVSSGNNIYLLFGSTTSYLPLNIITKRFDLSDITVNKNIQKAYLKGIGNEVVSLSLLTMFGQKISFQVPTPLVSSFDYMFASTSGNFMFSSSNGNFMFNQTTTSASTQTASDWFNKYYFSGGQLQTATYMQFQIASTANYTEVISCVIEGWVGRAY